MDDNEYELVRAIQEIQNIINIMNVDKDDISKCLGGPLCREYQETVELEISALSEIKKNLENFHDQYYFEY